MKLAILLFALAMACPSRAATTCSVEKGNFLTTIGGRTGKMDVPCKYGAVRQQCGDYFVRATPGNVYINRYFINTLWVSVTDQAGNVWEGRTSSKIAAKFINDIGDIRNAFHVKPGSNIKGEDILNFSKTANDVSMAAKDGSFSVTFAPFDPDGKQHRNAGFKFVCNRDDVPPAFPAQICGGEDKKDVEYLAKDLGFKPNKKFKPHMRDMTYYWAIFTDPDLDQSGSTKCGEARDTMLNVCVTKEKQAEAIRNCHTILYSLNHRKCATKYSCELIDVFAACVKYVCSDYTDMDACHEVGDAIDTCRNFPGLSENVKKQCYHDLFIRLDVNSTDYSD